MRPFNFTFKLVFVFLMVPTTGLYSQCSYTNSGSVFKMSCSKEWGDKVLELLNNSISPAGGGRNCDYELKSNLGKTGIKLKIGKKKAKIYWNKSVLKNKGNELIAEIIDLGDLPKYGND